MKLRLFWICLTAWAIAGCSASLPGVNVPRSAPFEYATLGGAIDAVPVDDQELYVVNAAANTIDAYQLPLNGSSPVSRTIAVTNAAAITSVALDASGFLRGDGGADS